MVWYEMARDDDDDEDGLFVFYYLLHDLIIMYR